MPRQSGPVRQASVVHVQQLISTVRSTLVARASIFIGGSGLIDSALRHADAGALGALVGASAHRNPCRRVKKYDGHHNMCGTNDFRDGLEDWERSCR